MIYENSLIATDKNFIHPDFALQPSTIRILGLRIHCLSYAEMHSAFDWWISDKHRSSLSVALVNVNCSVSALKSPEIFRCYESAHIRGIDSMPFLWLARILNRRHLDRLYAPDMMIEVAARATTKPYKFFLLGGVPGAGDAIKKKLEDNFPGLQVVGVAVPPFRTLTLAEDEALVAMINAAAPDFVWVGLGSPKQDLWIQEHRERIRGAVLVASGATFDFFSGRIRQAPKWLRSAGLEWCFRLTQDTRRLWRRYTLYNCIFIWCFFLELCGLKNWASDLSSESK